MPTLTKRGKSWQLNWRIGGQRFRKSLGDIPEHEAKLKLLAKDVEIKTGQCILPTGLLFRNFKEEYLNWYVVEYPDSYYRVEQIIRQHLEPVFELMPIDTINKRHAKQYSHDRLKAGAKRSTVNKELRTLRAFTNKAVEWDMIENHKLRGLKQLQEFDSKPPHFYTSDELEKLYQWSPYHWHWWRFMVNTGVRRKEALQINRKRDIGTDAIRIISTENARTKSAKWREIPLSDSALMAIERFGKKEKHLFPRVNLGSVSRAFSTCAARAELEGSLHSLRHSFCTHLVMNGTPLRIVQALAGHAKYSTTEKYAHADPSRTMDYGINL